MGSCKNPEPFQMVFPHVIVFFFPLIVFPSAGFTPWPKDSHERGKGEGKGRVKEGKRKNRKGRGNGKEKERKRTRKGKRKEKKRKEIGPNRKGKRKEKGKEKRKGEGKGRERKKERKGRGKGPCCITRTIFDAKSYRFRYRFVVVRESCVRSFFLEMASIIKKGV